MGVQRFAKQPLDTETSITIQHHEAIARSNDKVCTSERLWNSSVRTSWNRPVPAPFWTAPETAQIAPDPSGPQNRQNFIMLLIAKPSESGRLPNRRIWPLDPAPRNLRFGPPDGPSRRASVGSKISFLSVQRFFNFWCPDVWLNFLKCPEVRLAF